MTINRAMQLEEVNNELIQVLLGFTARVRTAVKMLKECDHDHTTVTTALLSTFQAEGLLRKVAPTAEGVAWRWTPLQTWRNPSSKVKKKLRNRY